MNRLGGIAIGMATALVIVAVAIVPFLTPIWLGFAQDRAAVTAWTGWPEADIRAATSAIVGELIAGNGDFDVRLQGASILNERERAHMRDVRNVFRGFYVASLLGVGVLAVGLRRNRSAGWRAVRAGATGLAAALVVAGVVVAVAFDAAFAAFHALFFPAGTWTFDPRTDRLVQLFPDQLWVETTFAVGVVGVVLALGVARFAVHRAR